MMNKKIIVFFIYLSFIFSLGIFIFFVDIADAASTPFVYQSGEYTFPDEPLGVYQGYPSCFITKNGTLYVSWSIMLYQAHTGYRSKQRYVYSEDYGQTWNTTIQNFSYPGPGFIDKWTVLSSGRVLCVRCNQTGYPSTNWWDIRVLISDDDGMTWRNSTDSACFSYLDVQSHGFEYNGSVYHFGNRLTGTGSPYTLCNMTLVRSDDEGENWIEVSHFQSDNPTGGSESALIVLKNGTFHAIIRSCYDDYESYDEGLTWVAVDPAIPYFLAGDGDNRWPTASWLDDENIFYTEENGSQPPGYGKYMLSNDNLSSVSNITTIYSYHIGGNSDGYPDHCILPLRSYNATHNYGGWAYVVYCDESNAFLRGIFVYNNQTYPKTFPESNIVINSINDLENNSVTTIGYRYFNWTRVDAATKYQLQISNDSLFTDVFVDLDDIYEGCPYEAMLGGSYEETGGYVEFYLPYAYNISWFGDHYYRVRAYSTDP